VIAQRAVFNAATRAAQLEVSIAGGWLPAAAPVNATMPAPAVTGRKW